MNPEQSLADIQNALNDARKERETATRAFEKAKASYWMKLVARRGAGEKLTNRDMEALLEIAISEDDCVSTFYLKWVEAESNYYDKKSTCDIAEKNYWDSKGHHAA